MKLSSLPKYARGYLRSRHFSRPPIIVGGCERSGTTLLQSILSAHPHIHAIDEELWAFCYGRPAGFRGNRPIRLSRLYKYLGSHGIPDTAWRWSEKSPANIYFFGEILEHFEGRVRLIQIVRDGRDVVTSLHPANPTRPWVSIERWVASVSAGLPYRNHENVLTIRYEDLVTQYEAVARRLCSFLEEGFPQEMLAWHSHARIRRSVNLMQETVGEMHSTSIRKFEAPGFQHHAIVEELLSNAQARSLLETYGFV